MTNPLETLNLMQIIVLKHPIIDKIINLKLKLNQKENFIQLHPNIDDPKPFLSSI